MREIDNMLKYIKKRQRMESGKNLWYDARTKVAASYDWWKFIRVYDGKLVFNNYSYSSTTCKHQSKMRAHLSKVGTKIDYYANTRSSLPESQDMFFKIERERILGDIVELKNIIAMPKTHKATNARRQESINELQDDLAQLTRLFGTVQDNFNQDVKDCIEGKV